MVQLFFVEGLCYVIRKKYRAEQMRYADGGGKNAQREEVEMKTKMKKEGRDCTS